MASNIAAFKAKLSETWDELPTMFLSSAENGLGRDSILDFIEENNTAYQEFLEQGN